MAHNPTPEQQAIIDFIAQQPTASLVVDARAGAAKSSTIEMAAPAILPEHSPLALAFNKRIADELKPRLPPYFTVKTMNALGHAAWATVRGKRLEVDQDKMFAIAKELAPQFQTGDSEADAGLIAQALQLTGMAKSQGLVPNGAPPHSRAPVDDHPDSWEDFAFTKGFELTDEAMMLARAMLKKSIDLAYQGRIDFADQIYMSVLFGGSYPRHHTVIVDEAQDLSHLNHLQLKKATRTRLIAVGDPYQAIYAFRGADSNSMTNLQDTVELEFQSLGLTKSFRVPHLISERQLHHVPDYGSMPWLGEGEVQDWDLISEGWTLDSIPLQGAILCRNNAPLLRLAFALIKRRRPVKILGRDIGAGLASIIDKLSGKKPIPIEALHEKLLAWKQRELTKAGDSERKIDMITDRYESLTVLIEAGEKDDAMQAAQFVRDLFSDTASAQLVLSSGHRAKGFEWDWVMHLEPSKLPSFQAKRAEMRGDPGPMLQEHNLKYVIETRTKDKLILAHLDRCADLMPEGSA